MTEFNEWQIWNATEDSECPVEPDTMVQVHLYRHDRCFAEVSPVFAAGERDWHGLGSGADIIAYRIAKPPPEPLIERMRFDYRHVTGTYEFGNPETHVGKLGSTEIRFDEHGRLKEFRWIRD